MNIGLSRKTDLAIKALRTLADRGERVSGTRLAKDIGTTVQFLPQVLGPLIKAGWIGSERGPRGGYFTVVPLSSLSLFELIEMTEGAFEDGRCVLREGPCPGTESCAVHEAWIPARNILVEKLQETSLEQALTTEVGA